MPVGRATSASARHGVARASSRRACHTCCFGQRFVACSRRSAPGRSVRLPSRAVLARVYTLERPKAATSSSELGRRQSSLRGARQRSAGTCGGWPWLAPEMIAVAEARAGAGGGCQADDRPARPGSARPAPRPSARGGVRRLPARLAYVAASGELAGLARRRARPAGLPRAGRRRRARRPRHVRAPRPGPTRARRSCRACRPRRARLPAACTATCGAATSSRTATTRGSSRLGVRAARRPGGGSSGLPGRGWTGSRPSSSTRCWRAGPARHRRAPREPRRPLAGPAARATGSPTSATGERAQELLGRAARLGRLPQGP